MESSAMKSVKAMNSAEPMKPPAATLRSVDDLCDHALVPSQRMLELAEVAARYAVAITPAMAGLIDPSDRHDPIARQFVPDLRELETRPQERLDPIGDDAFSPVEGVVHRYPDRALLKLVNACAVYCRFCFRREMVGPGRGGLSASALAAALDYMRNRPEIWEVILSGGDPLVRSPRRLKDVVARLAAITHVKVIRVHTRVPVVAPERITTALVGALRTEKATFVVLHANHPRELTESARAACARFVDAGIPMLSQSVLLRGVNDDAETLGALMRAFVECRIKPYYLHHADLAPGTAHLRTTVAEGQTLMRALRGRYSGLCQPAYMLDIPGGHGKSPIGPNYLSEDGKAIEDFRGERHRYQP
jgi:lysine 2,3-aminomutase